MKKFNEKIQSRFSEMSKSGKLFRTSMTGEQIWNLYLSSFTKENNPVFRDPASTDKNCNHCKNFIRRYGNIVSVDENYAITTMFDVDAPEEFANSAKAMSEAIKASKIEDVFFETFNELNSLPYETCKKTNSVFQLGVASNPKRYTKEEAEKHSIAKKSALSGGVKLYNFVDNDGEERCSVVKPDELRVFNHFNLMVDKMFVDTSGESVASLMAKYRDPKNVFQKGMEVVPVDTLELVKDLINQGSLRDGETHLYKLEQMIPLKKEYDSLAENQRDNWCWVKSYKLPIAKFSGELLGTLCVELAEGKELNKACLDFNKRVDPINYMKAKSPLTPKMKKDAIENFIALGYQESDLARRHATIEDIKASEILHINVGKREIKSVSILDSVKTTSTRHKRSEFDGIEEVSIEKFMKDILPSCTSVEAFLSNNQEGNLVSLTTTVNPDSKNILKWDNPYSWTFNGNLAGKSMIKDAVAAKGGKIDGVLRFSIMWAEGDASDNSDLDAWAKEPDGTMIGYSTGYRKDRGGNPRTSMSGQLDVDITQPNNFDNKNIVENIVWDDKAKMEIGVYPLWVNQYSNRNFKGFKAEIEFDGEIYSYEYNKPFATGKNVPVAEVTFNGKGFSIKHLLPETSVSSKELYGLDSNQFHKVNLVCLSPNHWGENSVGNKHYFFMLDGCKSPVSIRGFHIENLTPELAKNRNFFEVLGATNMIEPASKQLSGLGFNSTIKEEVVLRLQGTHKRMVKVKFGN